jgi:serine/threonine-protein kinase RsbW
VSSSVVTLTFPAKPDYLVLSRLALSGLARAYPVDPDVLADLKLAVTEACGNVVRHAYADGDGQVRVVLEVAGESLVILVEDHGSGHEASSDRDWELPEALDGGMGMAIIRAVVDELEVTPGPDGRGTVVRMTKRLVPPPDES